MKSKPLLPIVTTPSVVVCHEKHGNRYFSAKDDAELFETALKILKGRLARKGEWYYEPDVVKADPGFTQADVDKLPAALKDDAQRKLKQSLNVATQYRREKAEWDRINKAVNENDGKLAWEVLRDRNDHEYEGVSLEWLEKVYR